MSARSCRVDQQRCEALHPPKDRHVVDSDAPLRQQPLHVTVGGTVASADHRERTGWAMRPCPARVSTPRSGFAGFRFPPEVILVAVRWYLRYGLSYRDVEELLAERGIDVDHVSVFRWVQRFTPLLIDVARLCWHVPGGRWCVDETYVKVAGRWVGPAERERGDHSDGHDTGGAQRGAVCGVAGFVAGPVGRCAGAGVERARPQPGVHRTG